ncbi:MAG: CAP domain-containing protein [Pirellulales bacterium]|nr:CAP domain-containing protein [Planctomycetales bacterium]
MSPLVNLAIVASAMSSPNLPDANSVDLREVALNVVEASVIEKINDQREHFGRAPLEVDLSLMQSSRRHCSWMTRANRLQHTSAPVGENIAMGQRNASEAVRDWMNSPGHRANILNGRYSRVGTAAYVTGRGTIYWCMQFE